MSNDPFLPFISLSLSEHAFCLFLTVPQVAGPQLTSLALSWCTHVDDDVLGAFLRSVPNLEALDISGLWKLDGSIAAELPALVPKVHTLSVCVCSVC